MHKRYAQCTGFSVIGCLFLGVAPTTSVAWDNLLRDPGFEKYHFDNGLGYYVPDQDADWREVGRGQASVRFDAGAWSAPPAMTGQQSLGFSPGAMGYVGDGPNENGGTIILEQDVTNIADFSGSAYEAWVWFGGAGMDNETGVDLKEEFCSWEIWFYNNNNPGTWTESNMLERHSARMDFPGAPESFVQLSAFGKTPSSAVAFRMRIVASTWSTAAGPGDYDTKVAVDNAHVGIMRSSNLLVNGNFEMDVNVGDFTAWDRPAECRNVIPSNCTTFTRNEQTVLDIGDVYGPFFDSGAFLPYFGRQRAYGYGTWLYGDFIEDAFTFSQVVEITAPPGTPMTYMFYWIQDAADGPRRYQMHDIGGQIHSVLQYLDDGLNQIGKETFITDWPASSDPNNRTQYDHNGGIAFNPRYEIVPPAGTTKMRVNVSVQTHMTHFPNISHVQYAVDEFWLSYAAPVDRITQVLVHSITQNSAVVRWVTGEPRESRVDFGTTTSYGNTATDPTPVTLHEVTLTNLLPGREYFYKISSGNGTYPASSAAAETFFVTLGVGDFDLDSDVDQADYGVFQQCISGIGVAVSQACKIADLDGDNDVDNSDFGIFQACMSGANMPYDPTCAD